ncbi:MAG: sigma-54 interaction domain-containing protein [Planctomycetota bacterium]|jgi:DNA-binding NtrC family response regulator
MLTRTILALPPDHPCLPLAELLPRQGIEVETLIIDEPHMEKALQLPGDLFILAEQLLPGKTTKLFQTFKDQPERPHLVALMKGDSSTRRAELLLSGCDNVLSEDMPISTLAKVLRSLIEKHQQTLELSLPAPLPLSEPRLSDFVSNSPTMRLFLETVNRIIHANSSLLLLGETGVGKERLARAIHSESTRSAHPFIAINCGALPESLLESELFGHEEGAFTGASRAHRGCFEMAHGGTLFLDEIGEMPIHLQVKLLRTLQEKEIQRLGGEKCIPVDVRIIAATNRDLKEEVRLKNFRNDLFYRLSVVVLELPPLRERKEDIPELIQNYLEYLRHRIGVEVNHVTSEAVNALCEYDWPGNVRELINVMERAMLLCSNEQIDCRDLPDEIQIQLTPKLPELSTALATAADTADALFRMPENWIDRPWKQVRRDAVAAIEQHYLISLLKQTHGRIGDTAALAGIEPRSLYAKMKKYGIRKESFRLQKRKSLASSAP